MTRIAETLSISSKTVSTRRARRMEKMGFDSTADIVSYVITHRLS